MNAQFRESILDDSFWNKKESQLTYSRHRPMCCGSKMWCCGGTVGEITENSFLLFKCETCGQITEDYPS